MKSNIRAALRLILSVAILLTSRTLRADTLDDSRARGSLVWGADREGNAPYIYPDPEDPGRVIGFEVELAELLAGELGVRSEYHQCDWVTLPQFLQSEKIDIILNGYEWTPDRAARMAASRPYYIYELQLLARAADSSISKWEDLRARPDGERPSFGVLGGCAAADYLHANWNTQADIFEYDGNTNAMQKVRSGGHDATLLDLPMAIYYRDKPQGQGLKFVGEPVGRGFYVAYARKGDERLILALNAAIEKLVRDGRLKALYEKYGVWNATQESMLTASPGQDQQSGTAAHSGSSIPRDNSETSTSGRGIINRYGGILLKAAAMTVLLSVCAMPVAIILGLLVALIRMYGPAPLRWLFGIYVEVLRGTPVMLQLYVIYFLLPELLGFSLHPVIAAIVGLGINYSAYEAEIYRAGLQAIPRGQMEAALALGMGKATALRRVIVPQAVRIVVPPVTNDFIALFKDTSVCSVISVVELTKQYNMAVQNSGEILKLAAITALLYLAMSYPLSLVARKMEQRMEGSAVNA